MSKSLILFGLLLSLFPMRSFSQSRSGMVQGVVTDSLTGLAIENLTVFIPFTSVGTTTNSRGEYLLDQVTAGTFTLMFRHVAYQTATRLITTEANKPFILNLAVAQNSFKIDEVIKHSRIADWEQSYILFKKYFLGDTYGNICKIKNPRDLMFYFEGDVLMAYARKPLEITNRYLGYGITYFLDYFKLKKIETPGTGREEQAKTREGLSSAERLRRGWTEPMNNGYTRYFQAFSGSAVYKDLASEHRVRGINWTLNREAEFSGSLKHFLISLYRDTLIDSRYELRKCWKNIPTSQKNDPVRLEMNKLNQSADLDSIFFWDPLQDKPAFIYYLKNEKFRISEDRIKPGPQPGEKTLVLPGTVLFFFDTENTNDLKDDRIAEMSLSEGQLIFNADGNYYAQEGSRIWVYHDSRIQLKVLLPKDYLPLQGRRQKAEGKN